jgi:hypothetical protein
MSTVVPGHVDRSAIAFLADVFSRIDGKIARRQLRQNICDIHFDPCLNFAGVKI